MTLLSGATIYFCDERILLSDEDDWKRWIDLLVEAEHYSRNLQRTMRRTYKTKFRTHTDPGGMALSASGAQVAHLRSWRLTPTASVRWSLSLSASLSGRGAQSDWRR
ncbi:MAG TPA: hypothetical protein VMP86_07730 [Candidatus Binatia bacterium]|nr:hypothetical protein [Candidatus Binatia bacterium]